MDFKKLITGILSFFASINRETRPYNTPKAKAEIQQAALKRPAQKFTRPKHQRKKRSRKSVNLKSAILLKLKIATGILLSLTLFIAEINIAW